MSVILYSANLSEPGIGTLKIEAADAETPPKKKRAHFHAPCFSIS
jgi:hypothetical protein